MCFAFAAMVWDDFSHDLVISNSVALDTGLIHFVLPNDQRIASFGDICFRTDWASLLSARPSVIAAVDHEDVLSPAADESTDIADVWLPPSFHELSPAAQHYARQFPNFLQPIPEFADVRLPMWEAFVSEDALVLYSSPEKEKDLLRPLRTSSKMADLIRGEFDKLVKLYFVEPALANPHGIASRILPVSKPDGSIRVTVNCAQVNKAMQMQAFPLPAVSEILHFVARFKYRVTLDCSKGYHNFEIAPSSRWITRTIGAGLAYQWRKCVQGIASTCAFFQWAMSSLLRDVVFKCCVIYLDDIIVCGDSPQACDKHTLDVLRVLSDYGIRLNFAKCAFVPSTDVKVLGCLIKGLTVHPSPSIQNTVSQIIHPNSHSSSKKKFSALFHVLGLCAYLDTHCPGLKQVLGPLYSAVASPQWNWTEREEEAYSRAIALLHDLKPYSLPSYASDAMLELHSDSSDEAWSAVLWERRPDDPNDRSPANLYLLAMYGGLYNDRQFKWPTLVKEMYALKEGIERSDHFIRLSPVRCIVDSKVLTFCSISKNPMIQRWYAFIQRYQLSFVHVSSETNVAADSISRLLHTFLPPKPQPMLRPLTATVAPVSPIKISPDTSPVPSSPDVSIVTRRGTATAPLPPGRTRSMQRSGNSSPCPATELPQSTTRARTRSAPRRHKPKQTPPPLESTSAPPPSQSAPLADQLLTTILVHPTPTDGTCAPEALLRALRHLVETAPSRSIALPVDAQHLRDRLIDFIVEHSDEPFPVLAGLTFRQGIRQEYIADHRELRDSDFIREAMETDNDPVQLVRSFVGWTQAMRRPRAFCDEFVISAAALCFKIQICVIRICGFRRVPKLSSSTSS
jgi:hypothetical protein